MKVLILSNDFRVYWKRRLIYLKSFLASNNISFQAIELFGQGSPYTFDIYKDNASWWRCLFPDKSSEQLSKKEIQRALFCALDEINPDVIIGCSIVFYAGALGVRWAKRSQKKFIMFDDARPFQTKRNFLVQWVKKIIIEQVDAVWLPSVEYDKDYHFLFHKQTYFFYGYNAIDNEAFFPNNEKQLNDKTIVCVARLVPIKNLDNLLRAWEIIQKTNKEYKLLIIGDGPERDHLEDLKSLLKLDNVIFIGTVDNNNLPPYYHKADALVLPSLSESWGLVVNEAMAAGLPVLLSTAVNAKQALLIEGINGFSFDPFSIPEIAGTLLKYIELDIEIKKWMSANSLTIINTMSFQTMGIQLLKALACLNEQKITKPGIVAHQIINLWSGRYNKSGWDNFLN